jgi:hypothetical protein
VQGAPIRWLPTSHARRIARAHYFTENEFPEVGLKGWVRRSALGPYYRVRTLLVVSRRGLRATLYRRGQRIWTAPVGIGKGREHTPIVLCCAVEAKILDIYGHLDLPAIRSSDRGGRALEVPHGAHPAAIFAIRRSAVAEHQ